jgi:hypothetical protein
MVQDENERWLDFSFIANREINTKDNLDAASWLAKNNYIEVDKKDHLMVRRLCLSFVRLRQPM